MGGSLAPAEPPRAATGLCVSAPSRIPLVIGAVEGAGVLEGGEDAVGDEAGVGADAEVGIGAVGAVGLALTGPALPPVRQIIPSAWARSSSRSMRGRPRYSPSRPPRLASFRRFAHPRSFCARRVSLVVRARPSISFLSRREPGARQASYPGIGLIPARRASRWNSKSPASVPRSVRATAGIPNPAVCSARSRQRSVEANRVYSLRTCRCTKSSLVFMCRLQATSYSPTPGVSSAWRKRGGLGDPGACGDCGRVAVERPRRACPAGANDWSASEASLGPVDDCGDGNGERSGGSLIDTRGQKSSNGMRRIMGPGGTAQARGENEWRRSRERFGGGSGTTGARRA